MPNNPKNNAINVKVLGPCRFIKRINPILEKEKEKKYEKWFRDYIDKLPFSKDSKIHIKNKSKEISNLINDSVDKIDDDKVWRHGRLRKGMVVGSVQSGKTASMMGVIGNTIDKSTNIVIILSGTKTSLWHQTLLRVYSDLDNQKSSFLKGRARLILPKKSIINLKKGDSSKIYYSSQKKSICQSLADPNKVLIFIIPKIKEHIIDLAKAIQDSIKSLPDLGMQHMLVIDDESDDASILDAQKTKVIPYSITRLWAGVEKSTNFHETFSEELFATYLAYTATPQANILQSENNPLSPTDFLFTLKTPSYVDDQINFYDEGGILNYYDGGEIFYEQDFTNKSPQVNFIQDLTFDDHDNPDLEDSLQAYIVGAAINMLNSGKKYSKQLDDYSNKASAHKLQIPNYSMIYHPTAITDDHFLGKQQIIHWINNGTLNNFEFDSINYENQDIHLESFKKHFISNEEKWKSWVSTFNSSINFISETFNSDDFLEIDHIWSDLKLTIFDEIIPQIKVRVINSSADADDRPRFEIEDAMGKWKNVPDKLSIFVAGNVLSRGLTIENLAITVFARVSQNPAADTQMQMQRWFGYRGKILPYCRIYMQANQLELFREYHRFDKSLKQRIELIENNIKKPLEDLPWILEGQESRSTLKVATDKLPLRPNSYSQFGLIEPLDELRGKNQQVIENFIMSFDFKPILNHGKLIGHISSKPCSSDKIADILDELQYSQHSPTSINPEYHRWKEYAGTYGADYFSKRTDIGDNKNFLSIQRCPYTIAAYLRFWKHVSIQKNIPTNDLFVYPTTSYWKDYISDTPKFYITIRSGSGEKMEIKDKVKKISTNYVFRSPKNNFEFNRMWGTAGGGEFQYDDRLFDYHINGYIPVPKAPEHGKKGFPTSFRPSGHPGLLAIYFLKYDEKIQLGFGIGLPSGSPDHIRSMKD